MQHDIEVMKICVKAWLGEIHDYYVSITQDEEALANIRARVDIQSTKITDMPHATSTDPDDKLTETLSLQSELEQSWRDKMALHYPDIEQAYLLCYDPPNLGREVCWEKYVQKITWREIAIKHSYSDRRIRYIADDGIRGLYDEMPEQYRRYSIPNAMPK